MYNLFFTHQQFNMELTIFQSKFDMDVNAAPVRRACVAQLKRAVCQQRYRLKKKYFDPYPLHLVVKNSPLTFMSDVEWNKLVEHWKDEKRMVS